MEEVAVRFIQDRRCQSVLGRRRRFSRTCATIGPRTRFQKIDRVLLLSVRASMRRRVEGINARDVDESWLASAGSQLLFSGKYTRAIPRQIQLFRLKIRRSLSPRPLLCVGGASSFWNLSNTTLTRSLRSVQMFSILFFDIDTSFWIEMRCSILAWVHRTSAERS